MERVLARARRSARRAGAGLLIALSSLPLAAGCSADEGELELDAGASARALQVPSDPLFSLQWHYPAIRLPEAWELTTGTPNVRIAILDTGRGVHPDLNGKWVPGLEYDAVAQDANASNTGWAHANHVAGIAGGSTNNAEGGAGVCWGCQLLNVDVANGDFPDLLNMPRAVRWAVDNGAQVINLSLGENLNVPCSDPRYSALRDALAFAASRNVTVVAAAGNLSRDFATTVPAACPGVISVAAADHNNQLASYSNHGAVTLAAPGGGGVFTTPNGFGAPIGCPEDYLSRFTSDTVGVVSAWTTSNGTPCYRYLSGTSMAAPHVAGVVGLMLSRNPNLTPAQIRQILQSTAQPMPSCGGNCGAGLLDAAAAVAQAAALPVDDAAPVARFTAQCAGLDCWFDGSGSTDDRGIVAYQWMLPGPVVGPSMTPVSHPGQHLRTGAAASFLLPGYGSHLVRLRVTDAAGQSHELTQTVTPQQAPLDPRPGSYINTQRAGNTLDLHQTANGDWVLGWFTFDTSGEPVWYNSAVGPVINSRFQQPLMRYTWANNVATETQVGTIALDFSTSQAVWVSWVLHGVAGGERYQYLRGGDGRSGLWYAPSQPGWGFSVQESFWYFHATVTFYLPDGEPRWMSGWNWAGSNVSLALEYLRGPGLCPSCGGKDATVVHQDWSHPERPSSMNLQISDGASTAGWGSTDISRFIASPTTNWVVPVWTRSPLPIGLLTRP
ncbi:S8 family serine peptidase [Sorangium cellulosum]|uniref:Peptidase S8/S53 domain-containing protein n=1 Tax=Sorangium cellulosum So0157-2 TaxID=1254432 RepID=S4Y1S8_SORCE|nr:S8 family serine peptidase [Sorangium cellulosum]AGP38734.1 hypothetical protein SCE1572_32165 [Sorangium cellulosum So0157-2]